mgnify:CR=1 FL=1
MPTAKKHLIKSIVIVLQPKLVLSAHCLLILAFLFAIGLQSSPVQAETLPAAADYGRLIEQIHQESLEGPLRPFADFQPIFDQQCHQANLAYFRRHPRIIRRIKKDLDASQITWRLEAQKQRLLFVPEKRAAYARLYEQYCKDLVAYVLEKTRFENPFNRIVSLHEKKPEIPPDGVAAFLIHNLAEESVSKYVFSSEEGGKTSVLKLRQTDFVGRVGAYSSHIYPRPDGSYQFVRDHYTIWQNTANNPYTALTVPAEETLHILLRGYTEQAIQTDLMAKKPMTKESIREIADHWLAVEEAIVGGLVRVLVPSFLEEATAEVALSHIEQDLTVKNAYDKYRYLKGGIEIISDIGIQKAIRIYRHSPSDFKQALHAYTADTRQPAARPACTN